MESTISYDLDEFSSIKNDTPKENVMPKTHLNITVKTEKSSNNKIINSAKKRHFEEEEEEEEENVQVKKEVPQSEQSGAREFREKPLLKDRKIMTEKVIEKQSDKSGTILFSLNDHLSQTLDSAPSIYELKYTLTNPISSKNKFKYMMDKYIDRSKRIENNQQSTRERLEIDLKNENIIEITKSMENQVKLLITEQIQPFHLFQQERVVTIARIGKDAPLDGISTFYIEGKHAEQPVRTPISLDTIRSLYSIFPGQIVALKGNNPSSRLFRPIAVRNPPVVPPHSISNTQFAVSIMVASGPFTTSQNLSYFPFELLLKQIDAFKPTILLLIGPFVDSHHPEIESGDVIFEGDDVTCEELFNRLIRNIAVSTEGRTKVMVVPSLRDVQHNIYCYPQPAFIATPSSTENIMYIQDPSTVSLDNGSLTFGVTSSDILQHLSEEHHCSLTKLDKNYVLVNHLLEQGSYYPLYPPKDEQSLDSANIHLIKFSQSPNILFTPSDLPPFVKITPNDVVCVNPGRVANEKSMGSFALVTLHPSSSESQSFSERIRVDLIHV